MSKLNYHEQTAHPRSRGEHQTVVNDGFIRNGSSPLARGTPLDPIHAVKPDRLIPARAGNTRRYFVGVPLVAAHPRSRGEHAQTALVIGGCSGSSPLARGTLA